MVPIDTSPARADMSWASIAGLTTIMKIALFINFSLTKLMVSHDLPRSAVTIQIAFEQLDLHSTPEFERAMDCCCQVMVSRLETLGLLRLPMDYLRMDGKRGHVTCGNRLEIERQESFQKFASLQEELLLPSAQACWDPTRFRIA